MWLAFAVALFTTLGSLYLSQIAHFAPCPLCWYQRICMYPLSVALLVGGLRRDRDVWAYVIPPAVIGAVIAIYHTQLQAFPKQAHFCKIGIDSCTTRWVWEFGFVSIPFMSLAAFSFIIAMMLVVRSGRSDELETRTHRRVGSRRRTRPFPHEEHHEQAARSPPAPSAARRRARAGPWSRPAAPASAPTAPRGSSPAS